MLEKDLEVYACPVCHAALTLEAFELDGQRIREGALSCEACDLIYPVIGFVPRFLPFPHYNSTPFREKHGIALDKMLHSFDGQPADVTNIQEHTVKNFGHQWEHYDRFGWDDEAAGEDESRLWFKEKTLLAEDEVRDRLILDAGCGNGRYSRVASETGGRVFAVDLGPNVEVAYTNIRNLGLEVAAAQADIFNLPFAPNTFETTFTIGVIQHTGDPKRATTSLASVTQEKGLLSVRTYRRGNDILEANDTAMRDITTNWELDDLHEFSQLMYKMAVFLKRMHVLDQAAMNVNIFLDEHSIFDWYAAPVAAKLTYTECREWFDELNLEVLRDLADDTPIAKRKFDAISILGRKG